MISNKTNIYNNKSVKYSYINIVDEQNIYLKTNNLEREWERGKAGCSKFDNNNIKWHCRHAIVIIIII